MLTEPTTNPKLIWESTWKSLFMQALNEQEYQWLCAVKQAFETGELQFSGEVSALTKDKIRASYQKLITQRRPQLIHRVAQTMPSHYHLIQNMDMFQHFLQLLTQEEQLIIDSPDIDEEHLASISLIGLSFYLPVAGQAFYLPLTHRGYTSEIQPSWALQQLKGAFESKSLKKIGFHFKPLLHLLRREHIHLQGLALDVHIAAHLLNENEDSYKLEDLAQTYQKFFGLSQPLITYRQLFGSVSLETTSIEHAVFYACQQAELIFAYAQFVQRQFLRLPSLKKLYEEIEHPLIEVCTDMEETGLLVDLAYSQALQHQLDAKLETLTTQLKALMGDIDFNSNDQLRKFYYTDLKLPDLDNQKVNAETLKLLKDHHPSIEILLTYRKVRDLRSAVSSLSESADSNHRLRGTFHQCGATTGRFSCSNPNLQSLSMEARKLIIPSTGKIMVSIDYSQIEPRILSHITQDPVFMQAYIEGRDLYSEIASKTFKLPISECGDQSKWRKMIKAGMLSTMYGTGAHGLSKRLDCSVEEAEQFIIRFFDSYPVMRKWSQDIEVFAGTNGYVETMYGRKRRFPGYVELARQFGELHQQLVFELKRWPSDIWKETSVPYDVRKRYARLKQAFNEARRKPVNSILQGSSADLMKIALIKLHQFLKTKGPEWKILATIHDEVLFEIPASATREELEELAAVQREAVQLSVPMKVDIEIFQRWGCGMNLDEWFTRQESPLSIHHTF